MRDLSVLRRLTAVTTVCLLLGGSTGLAHEHVADHDGQRAHVEIPHGGHGGVVELPAARIRSDAPAPIFCLEASGPEWHPGPARAECERAPRQLRKPQPRPPPQPHRARAPPLS